MARIPVHPVEDDRDTITLPYTLRIQLYDVATDAPLTLAFAEQPEIDPAVLERRATHPFRVMVERNPAFWLFKGMRKAVIKKKSANSKAKTRSYKEYRKFTVPSRSLKTWVAEAAEGKLPKRLVPSWTCVPEFFLAEAGGKVLAAKNGAVFVEVDAKASRYVLVKSTRAYAQRALVSDELGILEIPLSHADWSKGCTVTLKLRDYKLLPASGPEDRESRIRLKGEPTENEWTMTTPAGERSFEESLDLEVPPRCPDCTGGIHSILLGVRKAQAYQGKYATRHKSKSYGKTGVIVHYNSGLQIKEERRSQGGKAEAIKKDAKGRKFVYSLPAYLKECKEAYLEGENSFLFEVDMALGLLRSLYGSRTTIGYHYHIARSGEIVSVVDPKYAAGHAGLVCEPRIVEAEGPDGSSAKAENTKRKTALNEYYVGVDLMGNAKSSAYYFDPRQEWYLDRLIENLMSRYPKIEWQNILGHDEARQALIESPPRGTVKASGKPNVHTWKYKVKKRKKKGKGKPIWAEVTKKLTAKPDPGKALRGGMKQLRWRHRPEAAGAE